MTEPKKDISTLADKNCKRCYGTGRIGFRTRDGKQRPIPCKCVKKRVFKMMVERDRDERIEGSKKCVQDQTLS